MKSIQTVSIIDDGTTHVALVSGGHSVVHLFLYMVYEVSIVPYRRLYITLHHQSIQIHHKHKKKLFLWESRLIKNATLYNL